MNTLELIREYFPDASWEEADSILWEFTGWPGFFDGDPETVLREQLGKFWCAQQIGASTCYGCGEIRWLVEGSIFCEECDARQWLPNQHPISAQQRAARVEEIAHGSLTADGESDR